MGIENSGFKIFYHQGNGGNVFVGDTINVKGKLGERGVHFHYDSITLKKATEVLRERGQISCDETVVELTNCGQDKEGREGHAARTDKMKLREESERNDDFLFSLFGSPFWNRN